MKVISQWKNLTLNRKAATAQLFERITTQTMILKTMEELQIIHPFLVGLQQCNLLIKQFKKKKNSGRSNFGNTRLAGKPQKDIYIRKTEHLHLPYYSPAFNAAYEGRCTNKILLQFSLANIRLKFLLFLCTGTDVFSLLSAY